MADPVRAPNRPAGGRTAVLEPGPPPGTDLDCKCCEPPSPLVLRPDLGRLSDGSAEYAVCVLHQPEPTSACPCDLLSHSAVLVKSPAHKQPGYGRQCTATSTSASVFALQFRGW